MLGVHEKQPHCDWGCRLRCTTGPKTQDRPTGQTSLRNQALLSIVGSKSAWSGSRLLVRRPENQMSDLEESGQDCGILI